jgi:hypothetical protein
MDEATKNLIPEADRDFLEGKEYVYEIIPGNGCIYLKLKNFDFPAGYTPQKADLLVIIPSGYPNAALDMFRTSPDVKLINNNWPQTAQSRDIHMGINWQVWSRHFIWRVGVDSLRTYLTAVKKELSKCV